MDLEQEVRALSARLRLLEDERELRGLLSRYAFAADTGRSRDWVALFAEDGAIDLGETVASMGDGAGPRPVGYPAKPRFEGHEELLIDFITALPHRRVEGRSAHNTLCGPLTFRVDGDGEDRSATATGYSMLVTREPGGFQIEMAAVNRWTFRRVDGAWRIVERSMRPIGSPDAPSLVGDRDA